MRSIILRQLWSRLMKNKLSIKSRNLLLIAGSVWLIAGFNVARLGLLSSLTIERQWYLCLLSILVFMIFATMFSNMSKKHTTRIVQYKNKQPFWQFFDRKSYILMAIMMGGGIALRAAGIFPATFVAFFYPGVGTALAFTGLRFLINYLRYHQLARQALLK